MSQPESDELLAAIDRLRQLIERLGFERGDDERFFGEVQGSPVTMLVCAVSPLSLLFSFKIAPSPPAAIPLPASLEKLVAEGAVEVSYESGIAWLSLVRPRDDSPEGLQAIVDAFGQSLSSAGVVLPPGCVECGSQDAVQVVFDAGRCSRLCSLCLCRVLGERDGAQQRLNRPSVLHLLGLPLALLYASGGWGAFWYGIHAVLKWTKRDAVVLDGHAGTLLVLAVLFVLGFLFGYPLGVFLRRSGIGRKLPGLVCLATVVVACILGEILYIALAVSDQTGFFSLAVAADLLEPVVRTYSSSWLFGKVLTAGAFLWGAFAAASKKPTAAARL